MPNSDYLTVINKISESKLCLVNDIGSEWFKILIGGFFCGILVYFGVEVFKRAEHGAIKVIGLILCVTVFVVCGFPHCIANMYYLGNSLYLFKYPLESFLSLLACTIGNSLGAIFIWFCCYLVDRLTKK